MKKLVLMMILSLFSIISESFGQTNGISTNPSFNNGNTLATNHYKEQRHAKPGNRYHKRQMRKMANADGKVTKRERRLLRRDRHRTH